MITEVTVRNFKKFGEETFTLYDTTVLAGPNNAGKTTLLQAIATWYLGLTRWREERSGSSATKRTGVPITRETFTAIPLREMNLLWEGRKVSRVGREKAGAPRLIEISLKGETEGKTWECGLEFQYANREMIWVRPMKGYSDDFPPEGAAKLTLVHIPPFSGIEPNESRHDKGYQDLLIGQGRPGEILRNLLLEVKERSSDDWGRLVAHMEKLFGIKLKEPKYSPAQPYIECEYTDKTTDKPLDLATAGSGLLQVLLLLAFFYARPSSVLLLDEPDAHLHIILQKETYNLLRSIARERQCQFIIATHSEVLLDATDPSRVVAFIGEHPHALSTKDQRNGLREALKTLSTMDLILAREVKAVLYTEGATDESILRAWSQVLGHNRMTSFFRNPYVVWLRGNDLKFVRHHFFALRSAYPGIRGVCLLDSDNNNKPLQEQDGNLLILRWKRYEIENYLVVPEAITRFIEQPEPDLFNTDMATKARKYLEEHLPAIFEEHAGDSDCLRERKASDAILVPLFEHIGKPLYKKEFYQLATVMTPEEIHPEIEEKLDLMADWFQITDVSQVAAS